MPQNVKLCLEAHASPYVADYYGEDGFLAWQCFCGACGSWSMLDKTNIQVRLFGCTEVHHPARRLVKEH